MATWASGPRFLSLSGFSCSRRCSVSSRGSKDPAKSLPRGLIGAMLILTAFAMLILFLGAGAAGASTLQNSGALW